MVTRSQVYGSTSTDGAGLTLSDTIPDDIPNKSSTSKDGACLVVEENNSGSTDEAFRFTIVNHIPIDDSFSFASSCHVFASNGNSSKITRFIMETCIAAVSLLKMSRKKTKRRLNKARKIASLPKVSCGIFLVSYFIPFHVSATFLWKLPG